MKALFVSNDPSAFVEGSAVRERLRTYAREIGELHVISRGPDSAEEAEENGLFLHPVRGGNLTGLWRTFRRAREIIRANGIAIVSAQDPFEHGLAALFATVGTPAKLHIQIHTDLLSPAFKKESLKNRARLWVAALVLLRADGIRAVSARIKNSLERKFGGWIPAPSVIPIALPENPPPKTPLPPNDFMFSFIAVSRLEPEKRIEDLLAALSLVHRSYPRAGLFIAGDGSCRAALTRRAAELGIADRAVFLGKRSDAWSLMQSAQAFIQASAYEGYGLTLLEAALASVPVISTDVGIVGEVLVPDESVLAVPVGDVDALARAMLHLIEKGDLGAELSARAKERANRQLAAYADQPKLVSNDLLATLDRGA